MARTSLLAPYLPWSQVLHLQSQQVFLQKTSAQTLMVQSQQKSCQMMIEKTSLLIEEEANGDLLDIEINVSDPEKVGDGMNAYMAYRVTTKTSLSIFHKNEFSVKRRFSDFLGLHSKLAMKYIHIGYIVPPAPEKSIVGMTKVKVGKEDSSSAEFIEKRRAALERYLQRTVKHPTLLQDPDLRLFLESSELPRAVNTQALSGAGILRMVNKAADAVNKMTIKMNESDAWFEEKQQQFENLDQQFRKLHASVEALVCHKKELSANTAAFAKSAAMLGNSEDHTALSRALSQLAEVEEKIDQLHQEQAFADFYVFSELLGDYIRLIAAVKGVFDHRMKCWQKWQDAQVTLQKKREVEAKFQLANRPDKLQQAKDDIKEVMLSSINIILEARLLLLIHSVSINALFYTTLVYKSRISYFPYLLTLLNVICLKYEMCIIVTHSEICKAVKYCL
ncbi:sorting nexin-2-like isoform X3 [Pseudopipra pipra]|uniref:sorting nexin-2-like isoform X3 n=1 Tax=Pseudopipra pipra TaxID=415032 RepID=UPI003139F8F6